MTPQRKEIRVALIGFGLAGSTFHAPLIESVEGLKLCAIVTSNTQRAAQVMASYPRAQVFSSVDEIWRSASDFDLIVVASPNRFHYDHAHAALDSDLHVVVDKPLAATVQECRDLINLSRKKKKILSVFQNRRWDNDFLTVKKLIENETLGKMTRFESRYERYRPEPKENAWRESADAKDAGGLLFDLGSHLIDQACTLFGDPKTVYAELDTRRAGAEVDDDMFVALQFPGGVKAHLWASSVARIKGPRFRVLGLKGSYEKFGLDPQEEKLKAGFVPSSLNFGNEPEAAWGRLSAQVDGLSFEGKIETLPGAYNQFYIQLRDAILHGAPIPVSPQDALRTMQIIEAAVRSSSKGIVTELEASSID
jgi:scyllo-inositol 2-dehydrogenase (NADP+)